MVKQVIVVNKGLNMSKGKMAAQVSHASMAFLTRPFYNDRNNMYKKPVIDQDTNSRSGWAYTLYVDDDVAEWMDGSFTKVILEVKNENGLEKVVQKAIENGLVENKDFFKIIDEGRTEFNGEKTWTCIGFKPMVSEKIDVVTKKLQLFKDTI